MHTVTCFRCRLELRFLVVLIVAMMVLQDLIIDAIYADIIRGKLDQKHQQLEVDFCIGRDIQPEHISEVSKVLDSWSASATKTFSTHTYTCCL